MLPNKTYLSTIRMPEEWKTKHLTIDHYIANNEIVYKGELHNLKQILHGKITVYITYINRKNDFGKVIDVKYVWQPTPFGNEVTIDIENYLTVYIIKLYGLARNPQGKGVPVSHRIAYVPSIDGDGIHVMFENLFSGKKSIIYFS